MLVCRLAVCVSLAAATRAEERRVTLKPEMLSAAAEHGLPTGWVDEQEEIIGPPTNEPLRGWTVPTGARAKFPVAVEIDLGEVRPLSKLWLFDAEGTGDLIVAIGEPGGWRPVATNGCRAYRQWVAVPLDAETRFLRLVRTSPGANVREIAVYQHTPESWRTVRERQERERREATARAAALERARAERRTRSPVDPGPPFGPLPVVDELDPLAPEERHAWSVGPPGSGAATTLLGRAAFVLPPRSNCASWVRFRLGRDRGLEAGGAYVLQVEYPEDAPRAMWVINAGNESVRGFHTGRTVGDALHMKYLDSLPESLDMPLSQRWCSWTMYFRLHDRFPTGGLPRGSAPRPATPADGFEVAIVQFDARNDPMSAGLAIGKVRLLEVAEPERLRLQISWPPEGLPRRRIFWREEMGDGVIEGADATSRGVEDRLNWFRWKADLMEFLGVPVFAKDLLEFGACQHWDPTPGGGNDWVYFNSGTRDLWGRIVGLMAERGIELLPYYEYAGSIGRRGLGPQRRAKPLTREDAYTHIPWVEKANVDITDPATWEDLRKILDITVLAWRDRARFAGVWMRPRSQWPVGFGDATRQRFAHEANGGRPVTRDELRRDPELYGRYLAWWLGRRRQFLEHIRDHLRAGGVPGAFVLFTGCAAEPGPAWPDWTPRLVTDRPDLWQPLLASAEHRTAKGEVIRAVTPEEIVRDQLYLRALRSPGLTWGRWEVHHANPTNDPEAYREADGIMFTHAVNRLFTVSSPATFDAFRSSTGLAIVRHHALNEHMVEDEGGGEALGYFVGDMERAAPFSMCVEVRAVAAGDPSMIGYLSGRSFNRGFPEEARRFHAAFLALPALPSRILEGACDVPDVTVREIRAPTGGVWWAVAHTGWRARPGVEICLPGEGPVFDAVSGERLSDGRRVRCDLAPCELRAWRRP
ncbi:MAG: hypothetical protein N2652_00405 [Kiritimatiellae bacterium]|nr:hypothetical protein [Kiritimatiellia bacterium]